MLKSPNSAKITPKQLQQILIGVAVLILLGGGGLIYTMNAQIDSVQNVADNREAQVGSSEQVMQRYQDTFAAYKDTLQHLQYLEGPQPPSSYIPTLLQQVNTLAQSNHLTLNALRPSTPPPPAPASVAAPSGNAATAAATAAAKKPAAPPPFDTVDVIVEAGGSYRGIMGFLYGLTKFPKIAAVTNIQMQPGASAANDPNPTLSVNLHLTAYMFHDDAAGAQPAAAALNTPGSAATPTDAAQAAPTGAALRMPGAPPTRHLLGETQAMRDRAAVGISTL